MHKLIPIIQSYVTKFYDYNLHDSREKHIRNSKCKHDEYALFKFRSMVQKFS